MDHAPHTPLPPHTRQQQQQPTRMHLQNHADQAVETVALQCTSTAAIPLHASSSHDKHPPPISSSEKTHAVTYQVHSAFLEKKKPGRSLDGEHEDHAMPHTDVRFLPAPSPQARWLHMAFSSAWQGQQPQGRNGPVASSVATSNVLRIVVAVNRTITTSRLRADGEHTPRSNGTTSETQAAGQREKQTTHVVEWIRWPPSISSSTTNAEKSACAWIVNHKHAPLDHGNVVASNQLLLLADLRGVALKTSVVPVHDGDTVVMDTLTSLVGGPPLISNQAGARKETDGRHQHAGGHADDDGSSSSSSRKSKGQGGKDENVVVDGDQGEKQQQQLLLEDEVADVLHHAACQSEVPQVHDADRNARNVVFLETSVSAINLILTPATDMMMDPMLGQVTSMVLTNVAGEMASNVGHSLGGGMPDQIIPWVTYIVTRNVSNVLPDSITQALTTRLATALTNSLGLALSTSISDEVTPRLHKHLAELLPGSISGELNAHLPIILGRALPATLLGKLTYSLTHTLVPVLSRVLAPRQNDWLHLCWACRNEGKFCDDCRYLVTASWRTNYFSAYYSNYFVAYYNPYYKEALAKVDSMKHGDKQQRERVEAPV